METALALYEALLQANVPSPAARRVAESLEKDMSSNLATKQDVEYLDRLMASRIDAVEGRVALQLQNLESRLIAKLGAMMTVLFGLAATVAALLR